MLRTERKLSYKAALAGLLLCAALVAAFCLPFTLTAHARRDVPEKHPDGQIIDLTQNALFEEDVWEGRNFYVDANSRINSGERDYEIRYADRAGYFVYALKVPATAEHLYQDGRYSGLQFIEAFSFDYENTLGYYGSKTVAKADEEQGNEEGDATEPEIDAWEEYVYEGGAGPGHTNSVLDLIELLGLDAAKRSELDTLNGGNGWYMVYLKFYDKNPEDGFGSQIIGRLRFSTEARILSDSSAPQIYEKESKGFAPDVYGANDADYLFALNGSTTSVSAGKTFRKFDGSTNGSFFGEILGDYGIYRFTFDTNKGDEYSFAKLALDIEIWGHFRLSISNGKKMPHPDGNTYAGRYTAASFWDEIQCGYFGKPKSSYSLDISDWIYDDGSGSCTVYLRVADATDSDGANGGQVGQMNMTAYYAYSSDPVISGENPSGYVGLPVDLSVITATAGIQTFGADVTFEVSDASGTDVELSESGISFVPTSAQTYKVKAIATDGNGNTASRDFEVAVSEFTKTISGVSVSRLPDKTSFEYNKPIDVTGGKVTIAFSDGSDYTVSLADCKLDKQSLTTLGVAKIGVTFEYGGKSFETQFDAECVDYVASIAIVAVKGTVFYTGSVPDLSRFTVRAYYAGGKAAGNAEDSYIVASDDEKLKFGDIAYDDAGRQTVTLYYGDVSVDYELLLAEDSLAGVEVGKMPDKTSFKLGELVDFTGGTLTLTYKSGRTEALSMRDNSIYFVGFDKNHVGTYTVIMMYGNYSVKFELTVTE